MYKPVDISLSIFVQIILPLIFRSLNSFNQKTSIIKIVVLDKKIITQIWNNFIISIKIILDGTLEINLFLFSYLLFQYFFAYSLIDKLC